MEQKKIISIAVSVVLGFFVFGGIVYVFFYGRETVFPTVPIASTVTSSQEAAVLPYAERLEVLRAILEDPVFQRLPEDLQVLREQTREE